MDIFAERFKSLKEAKGLTYSQIAEHLGLKQRAVKCYSSGESKPDYYGLLALADYFDVSLDFITGRCDNPNSHKS